MKRNVTFENPMTKKIKIWLVFVLFYILSFFVWWTFKLIDFSAQKQALMIEREEARAKLECIKMHQHFKDSVPLAQYKSEIDNYTHSHCKDLTVNWDKGTNDPELVVSAKIVALARKEFEKEKTTFLLEGVTMFLLIAAGVVWIFFKIGKILNLSKQQNNFLLSVSHELKTPITAIQLASQTLSFNFHRITEEMKMNLLGKIDSNTKRLDGLIDQMLMLTRIEGANYQYQSEEINIKEMCNAIVANSSLKHNEKEKSHFTVINNLADNLIVNFDRLTLELCLSNVIENAIKYSPNGGNITFSGALKAGFVQIEIADEGVGIPEGERTRVFEKFYRVGNEDTRTTKGTGLGLYLVSQVLKKNKGSIKIKENEPNGSIFVLKLKK